MANASPPPLRLFLSHAAVDAAMALGLADEIRSRAGLEVFVASQPGQIQTGERWMQAIESKLQTGDAYLILLTPRSVERPWVWFEVGSVWFAERRILPVTGGGLHPSDVPYPLGSRQILDLTSVDDVRQLFRDLGIDLDSAEAELLGANLRGATATVDTWKSLRFEDRVLVWDGPLSKLPDWSSIVATRALVAFLESNGLQVRCGSGSLVPKHHGKGYRQVYESDLSNWKRVLMCPDYPEHFLLCRPRGGAE